MASEVNPKRSRKMVTTGSSSMTERIDDTSSGMELMGSIMRSASMKHFQPTQSDTKTLQRSLWAVRFGLFADAMSTTILYPNYAFLVKPGASQDSFESTGPFDFAGATYFIPMTALFAAAITSCCIGSLSDRFGRRPAMILCVGLSVFWTIGKYLARGNFWGFSTVNLVNGLFAGTLPISTTYASDVSMSRRSGDREMSYMGGIYFVGMRCGGIATIIMSRFGLFTPLLVGAFVNAVAAVALIFCMVEPSELLLFGDESESSDEDEDEDLHGNQEAVSVRKPLFANVYVVSICDAIADNAVFPLAMAPVAFNAYLGDMVANGEDPVMSPSVYKWCSVFIGMMAMLGSFLAGPLHGSLGVAVGCILGNLITSGGPLLCLFISELEPTRTTLAIFVSIMYAMYPFVITNKLGIGLMIDRIAPMEQRGFFQGLHITLYQFSQAIAPFVLGVVSDNIGVATMMRIVCGIGFLGAIMKIPLLFADSLGRTPSVPSTAEKTKKSISQDEKPTSHTVSQSRLDDSTSSEELIIKEVTDLECGVANS